MNYSVGSRRPLTKTSMRNACWMKPSPLPGYGDSVIRPGLVQNVSRVSCWVACRERQVEQYGIATAVEQLLIRYPLAGHSHGGVPAK
jgi:hypothetical protein